MCYCGNTVAALTASCHCPAQACRHFSWTVLFLLHATSISSNHGCHGGACYYRPGWVTTVRLVTPRNSPVIQLEINVCVPWRHFSLISFLWWWREVLFYWHFNSSSRDKKTKPIHLSFSVKLRILTHYCIEQRSMIQQALRGVWLSWLFYYVFYFYMIFENMIKERVLKTLQQEPRSTICTRNWSGIRLLNFSNQTGLCRVLRLKTRRAGSFHNCEWVQCEVVISR